MSDLQIAAEHLYKQTDGESDVQREVPPQIAPSVKLLGQMSGTGFEQQPWLVERDSKFLQVTELLYRILERIDGNRTSDQIAAEVTDCSEWLITGPQVHELIESRLAPLGLVVGTSGSAPAKTSRLERASPLAVNMKLRTIGPGLLNPIARVFQFLFHPAVLVPMLACAVAAHWWLYRVHGLADSFGAMLNTPGGLLLIIGAVFAAGLFHELGHASALKYGGGYVRGMGIGLYLMYPAFYTDVTDGYRLTRGARVRTDLGGVYFHAIACLALIGISVWLRAELLLMAVVLINFEMARQFIPFVKLDGYWLLADLTGIPDFFSQMGPFVRSLAPQPLRRGRELPTLKPWVKAVFATYILGVIPALAYLTFLMVKYLPGFVETTVSAMMNQASALMVTVRNHDYLTFTLLCITLTLLAASIVGAFLLLALAILRPVIRAWRWTGGISRRVMPVAAGTAALAGAIGFMWYPEFTGMYERLSAPAPTRRAVELLQRAAAVTAGITSLRADLEGAVGSEYYSGTVTLKRPNFARIEVNGEGGIGEFRVISDGQALHTFFPRDNRFVDSAPGRDGELVTAYVAEQVDLFFRPDSIKAAIGRGKLVYSGRVVQDATTYQILDQSLGDSRRTSLRYYIGQSDGLIHGVTTSRAGETVRWTRLKGVQLNPEMDSSEFAWRAPVGAGPVSMPAGVNLPLAPAN